MRHVVIPDTQIRPGVPTEHITWAARAIVDYLPDVVVVMGDWWDLPSLSTHDAPGSKEAEGRRVRPDIDAGNEAFKLLVAPIEKERARRRKYHRTRWEPQLHFLFGNHEDRLSRAIARDPKWDGMLSLAALETPGFERHDYLKIVNLDGIKYCLAPEHKALTADLRWVQLGDLKPGDKLTAFDEHSPGARRGRRYCSATVESVVVEPEPTWIVEDSSGKTFRATADHQWLTRAYSSTGYRWTKTSELRPRTELLRLMPQWSGVRPTWEYGYIGGVLDGEGCLSKPTPKQGGIQVGIAQRDNECLAKFTECLRSAGIAFSHDRDRSVHLLRLLGPSGDKLKVLAEAGAGRLMAKFRPEMLGRVQAPDNGGRVHVVSVVPDGVREVAKITTTSRTMIVDGYAHHNCHYFPNPHTGRPIGGTIINRLNHIGTSFVQGHQQGFLYASKQYPDHVKHGIVCGRFYQHSESYRPQDVQNSEWNGIIVLNEVNNGNFDIMPLSINYLRSKFA